VKILHLMVAGFICVRLAAANSCDRRVAVQPVVVPLGKSAQSTSQRKRDLEKRGECVVKVELSLTSHQREILKSIEKRDKT
jgi:hypothetical protein